MRLPNRIVVQVLAWAAFAWMTVVLVLNRVSLTIGAIRPLYQPARLPVVMGLALLGLIFVPVRGRVRLLFLALILALAWIPLPITAVLLGIGLFWLYRPYHRTPGAVKIGRLHPIPLPMTLSTRDRFMHTHVIGPTGSGKSSSILMPLIAQDLSQRRGLTLIEPKGDLSRAAYRAAIQSGHTVIYFDPHDPHCPHYNPLHGDASVAAEGLSWALNQLSESGHPFYAVTHRVQLMYSVMAVKAHYGENCDLTHVLDFLRLETVRKTVLSSLQDARILGYFRDQIGQIGAKTAQEQRQGLLNRLELLLVNPNVRRVLTGTGDFDWDAVLENQYTVICPLSLAQLGDSAKVLGTLLWHGLAMATYRRSTESGTKPYFLYLDEFHQYVTPDLSDFLALARGYSMGLVLAHQDLGQLSPELKEALLANARHRVVFGGIAPEDVRVFNDLAKPYRLPENLRYLPRGQAYVQITRQGRLMKPRRISLYYHPLEEET